MQILTSKGDYGLLTMVALAKLYPRAPVPLVEISEAYRLPHAFLEQIMMELKNAGLVRAFRGKYGGYGIDRPPTEISVAEVIEALEGPLTLVNCQHAVCPIGADHVCLTRGFWWVIHKNFHKTLRKIKISDLLTVNPYSLLVEKEPVPKRVFPSLNPPR